MLNLVFRIILLLIFEMPNISNAAGVYDNSLINADKKKNEGIKNIDVNEINLLNHNADNIKSEYDVELRSIFEKNIIVQKIQNKPSSYKQYYPYYVGTNNYVQLINNDGIDAQLLLETMMVWKEIKADLKQSNVFFNNIEIWANNFIVEYLDVNYVSSADAGNMGQKNEIRNSYEGENMLSNMAYKNDAYYRSQDKHKTSLNNNYQLNNKYEGRDENSVLSLIYLWEEYSDIIVGMLAIVILWLFIANLIKFLTRTG